MGETDTDFKVTGDRTLDFVLRLARLKPSEDLLDLGCGYGRLAHAVLRWGEFTGTYTGLDILPRHVAWCAKHLARDGITFEHLDIKNDRYNPEGNLTAADLDLGSERFDVVVVASVFTHMYVVEIDHYFAAMARSLRPGGRIYSTWFLLDDNWRRMQERGIPSWKDMAHELGPTSRYMNPEDPLHAIAHELSWVQACAERHGLEQVGPVDYGFWSGRNARTMLQDGIVFAKPDNPSWGSLGRSTASTIKRKVNRRR